MAGTWFWVVTKSSTQPSAEQIAAGLDHLGELADAAGDQIVESLGVQPEITMSGLEPSTQFWRHDVHEGPLGYSNIVTSPMFETEEGGEPVTWEDVLAIAIADGWVHLYDPTNPNTRTLRADGGLQHVEAIADSLGNWPDSVQPTAALQPYLEVGFFGGALDAMKFSAGQFLSAPVPSGSRLTNHATLPAVFSVMLVKGDVPPGTSTNQRFASGDDATSGQRFHHRYINGQFVFGNGTWTEPMGEASMDRRIWSCRWQGDNSAVWRNSSLRADGFGTTTSATNSIICFGARGPGGTLLLDGRVGVYAKGIVSQQQMLDLTDLVHAASGIAKE